MVGSEHTPAIIIHSQFTKNEILKQAVCKTYLATADKKEIFTKSAKAYSLTNKGYQKKVT